MQCSGELVQQRVCLDMSVLGDMTVYKGAKTMYQPLLTVKLVDEFACQANTVYHEIISMRANAIIPMQLTNEHTIRLCNWNIAVHVRVIADLEGKVVTFIITCILQRGRLRIVNFIPTKLATTSPLWVVSLSLSSLG